VAAWPSSAVATTWCYGSHLCHSGNPIEGPYQDDPWFKVHSLHLLAHDQSAGPEQQRSSFRGKVFWCQGCSVLALRTADLQSRSGNCLLWCGGERFRSLPAELCCDGPDRHSTGQAQTAQVTRTRSHVDRNPGANRGCAGHGGARSRKFPAVHPMARWPRSA
jgi:hypothetical protein